MAAAKPQDHPLKFKHLTVDDGLSQGLITGILQDSKGYMWFGTMDGLNRYDGYRFSVFRSIPSDSTSLSSSSITTLYEDRSGRLWVGTKNKLNLFERGTETFRRISFREDHQDRTTLNQDAITSISEDDSGILWIGTENGLVRYSSEKESHTRYVHDPAEPTSLRDHHYLHVLVDSQGILWVGSKSGLNRTDLRGRKGDDTNSEIAFLHFKKSGQTGLSDDHIVSIYEDPDSTLWFGTHSGLFSLTPENRKKDLYRFYPHEKNVYREHWMQRITSICKDLDGRIWTATPGALAIFDPETGQVQYVKHNPQDAEGLNFNGIHRLYHDRSGKIWVGTIGKGLNIYDQHAKSFKYYTGYRDKPPYHSNFSAGPILEDASGLVWIVVNDKLYLMDRLNGEIREFKHANKIRGTVHSLLLDRTDMVWIGADDGLYRYDPNPDKLIHLDVSISTPDSSKEHSIRLVYEDNAGRIWCTRGGYLYRWDPDRLRFDHYNLMLHDGDFETYIHENPAGVFWIGLRYHGLMRFQPDSGFIQYYRHDPADDKSLSSDYITTIHPDPNSPEKILWIGTGGSGLNRFDTEAGTFDRFTEEDGLPNNFIYGILGDSTGKIWMSTNYGLVCFDPSLSPSPSFHSYDVTDGLQSNEFNGGSFHKSGNGEFYFGGINGINAFYPEQVGQNTYIPPIVFTDFLLLNRSVSVGKPDSPLQKTVGETNKIILSHRYNDFTFEFAALDFTAPDRNQYAYLLEGFHDEWIYTGTNRRAVFTHLNPGKYLLRVKGSNSDGIWNEEGTSIKITIEPPIWRTWWALVFYLSGILAIGYGVRRYELGRMRLKHNLDRIREEMNLASKIQLGLLPQANPGYVGYDIVGRSTPYEWVGGDYYDYIPIGAQHLAVCLGDVSGKGLPAALLMANLQAIMRSQSIVHDSTKSCVQRTNQILFQNTDAQKFVTLVYSILDVRKHRLRYCNAGHNRPLLFNEKAEPDQLCTGGPILGFVPGVDFEEEVVAIAPGNLVVFYSDGITETMNAADEMFGEQGLIEVVRDNRQKSSNEIVEAILQRVTRFAGGEPIRDDMTIIVIKREKRVTKRTFMSDGIY